MSSKILRKTKYFFAGQAERVKIRDGNQTPKQKNKQKSKMTVEFLESIFGFGLEIAAAAVL